LRDTGRGRVSGAMVDEATAEPFRQDSLVHGDVFFYPGKSDVVEKALDVPFQDPAGRAFLAQYFEALVDGIRTPSLGPKSVGITIRLSFGNRLQRL
jgi:hypothetical protein